jgi:hypothetical protein
LSQEQDVRGIAGVFQDGTSTADSDHGSSTAGNNNLVQFTGMSISPLEVVERQAIDFFVCSHQRTGVRRDDITGICYERDNACIPVWSPDTADGADSADDSPH